MPVSEWVPAGGVSLRTDLDQLLKAELRGEGRLRGDILKEAKDRVQRLPVKLKKSNAIERAKG
jgi:hypothetical protein